MKSCRTQFFIAISAALLSVGAFAHPESATLPSGADERGAHVSERAHVRARAREKNRVPTAAEMEIERELRASGIDQIAKSFASEEMIGLLFGLMRGALNGKEMDGNSALEKKMEQMADELPKKIAPVMAKVMDIAEQEMKRTLKEAAQKESLSK